VTLTFDKPHYTVRDTIQVTIHNSLSASIYVMDHGTSCTVARLQRWVNGAWANTAECPLMSPTRFVPAQAGATVVDLVPGALQVKAGPWTPGTYRIMLSYLTQPDGAQAMPTLVTSASFAIG